MDGWFEEWGWMFWIFIGFVCYEILTIRANDKKTSPLAVAGACVIGPLMLIIVWFCWKEGKNN